MKLLGIQKQMTLHFVTQDKCMSICLAFSISDLLHASFSFQSSYSSSACTCPEAVFQSHLHIGAHLPVQAGKGNKPSSRTLDPTKPAIELSANQNLKCLQTRASCHAQLHRANILTEPSCSPTSRRITSSHDYSLQHGTTK